MFLCFLLSIREPPRFTLTATLVPYTTLFRSCGTGSSTVVAAFQVQAPSWPRPAGRICRPPPRRGRPMGVWGGSRRTAMRQTQVDEAAREDGGAKPPAPRASLYEDVTRRIIAELEAGRFPWVPP